MVKLVALAFLVTLVTFLLIIPVLRIIINFKKIKKIPLGPPPSKKLVKAMDESYQHNRMHNPSYNFLPQNIWHNRK